MIWAAAGLGITVGAGFYVEAITATVLMFIAIDLLSPLLIKIGPKTLRQKELRLKVEVDREISLKETFQHIRDLKINIKRVKIKDNKDTENRMIDLVVTVHNSRFTSEVYEELREIKEILSIEVELL